MFSFLNIYQIISLVHTKNKEESENAIERKVGFVRQRERKLGGVGREEKENAAFGETTLGWCLFFC